MAITYGSWNGRLRIGIDVDFGSATTGTTVPVTVRYYVQTDGYDFNDSQTLVLGGEKTGEIDFSNTLTGEGQQKLVYTWNGNTSTNYAGNATCNVSARLTGAFNGATPSHSVAPRVPARKPDQPNACEVEIQAVTSEGARFGSPARPDGNGASVTKIRYRYGSTNPPVGWTTEKDTWSTHTWTGAARGERYYVMASAGNSAGWGPYGGVKSFVTLHTAPDRPSTEVTEVKATEIAVEATNAAYTGGGLDAVAHYLSESSSFSSATRIGSRVARFTGLDRYKTYYIRYRTSNSIGESDWSNVLTVRTKALAPSAPPTFAMQSKGITTATVAWGVPADSGGPAVTQYRLERKLATSSTWTVRYTGSARTFADTGLTGGTAYNYRVAAYHGVDSTSYGAASLLNLTTNPANAAQPVQIDATPSSVALDWDATSGATQYGWEVRTADAGGGTVAASGTMAAAGPVEATGLAGYTTYFARTRVTLPSVGAWTDSTPVKTSPPLRRWKGSGFDWADEVYVWKGGDWVPAVSVRKFDSGAFVSASTT